MEAQLASMFSVIHGRSVAAVKEDIGRFERVQKARSAVLRAEHDLRGLADQEFAHIPGQDSPHLVGKAPPQGGAARAKFVEEWNRGLTLLRKLGESTAKLPRPSWVQADVSAAIAFDQATEFFYTRAVRRDGRRRDEVVDELHLQNRADPEAAVRHVFKDWAAFDGNEGAWEWARWCNENPKRLRYCLSSPSLAILTKEVFAEVTWLTHAAREHARQIDNRTLGLAPGTELSISQRCTAYAHFLFAKRSAGGHSVSEVLQYVLWGDRTCPDAAQRVWEATQHAEWRLPHLGPSILGEMIGYARPDEYPPRNQRVVRTLVALGYEGLAIA